MTHPLDQAAADILAANDRGGYTVPTARLYPYQWNWDSGFCALGWGLVDRKRAWLELDTLFEAQWPDGMVPHIIFRRDDPDYFPGPSVWQSGTTPPSSGHSQPPVVASAICWMLRDEQAGDAERARALFDKLLAWHRWYHEARDPDALGVVAAMHPWESGRDNCPDWDSAMSGVAIAKNLEPYERRDTGHVNATERPSKAEYDRFLSIIAFGRERAWSSAEIAENGPFWVADPGINFILLRADRDLLKLAERFGQDSAAHEISAWIARSEQGLDTLWCESVGGYCARDLRTGTFSKGLSSASALAFFAKVGSNERRQTMLRSLQRIAAQVRYMMPSWDPADTAFEPVRYWRGPVWGMMNFMLWQGLREEGHTELAERVRADLRSLIEGAGFYEYFCPLTGKGCGGDDFSWTAAMWLAFASPSATRSLP